MDELARYFDNHVVPLAREYQIADSYLCKVSTGHEAGDLDEARSTAERRGKVAAQAVFHFADHVMAHRPPWVPAHCINIHQLRKWVGETHCLNAGGTLCHDYLVIEAVANASKHQTATKSGLTDDGTLAAPRAYGELAFNEGWGEGHTVVVNWNGGKRALISVMASTLAMWERAMGRAPHALDGAYFVQSL